MGEARHQGVHPDSAEARLRESGRCNPRIDRDLGKDVRSTERNRGLLTERALRERVLSDLRERRRPQSGVGEPEPVFEALSLPRAERARDTGLRAGEP